MPEYEATLRLRGDTLMYTGALGGRMEAVPAVSKAVVQIKARDKEHAVELLFEQLNGWIDFKWVDGSVEVELIYIIETWADDDEGIQEFWLVSTDVRKEV